MGILVTVAVGVGAASGVMVCVTGGKVGGDSVTVRVDSTVTTSVFGVGVVSDAPPSTGTTE